MYFTDSDNIGYFTFLSDTDVESDRVFFKNKYGYIHLTSIFQSNMDTDIHIYAKTDTDIGSFGYLDIRIHPYLQGSHMGKNLNSTRSKREQKNEQYTAIVSACL